MADRHLEEIATLLEVLEAGPCAENLLAIKANADRKTVAAYIGVLTSIGLAVMDMSHSLHITTKGLMFLERYEGFGDQLPDKLT
jgi:predicted transcriptional regulator